jgi:hypothetical protein
VAAVLGRFRVFLSSLQHLSVDVQEAESNFADTYMRSLSHEVVKTDHTFDVAKVRAVAGFLLCSHRHCLTQRVRMDSLSSDRKDQSFGAYWVAMDGINRVLTHKFVPGKLFNGFLPSLNGLQRRFSELVCASLLSLGPVLIRPCAFV